MTKTYLLINLFSKFLMTHLLRMDLAYIYQLGSLLGISLCLQMVSGLLINLLWTRCFMGLSYLCEHKTEAFIKGVHTNLVILIFILFTLHGGKSLLYLIGSHIQFGVLICGYLGYFLAMLSAVFGYSLVGTSLGVAAVTVMFSTLKSIPHIGGLMFNWLLAGDFLTEITLIKMHTFHMIFPLMLLLAFTFHLIWLHSSFSSDGFFNMGGFMAVYFSCLQAYKDLFLFAAIFLSMLYFFFIKTTVLQHQDAWYVYSSVASPSHLSVEFYLLFLYGMLKMAISVGVGLILILWIYGSILGLLGGGNMVLVYHQVYQNHMSLLVALYVCLSDCANHSVLLYPLMDSAQLYLVFLMVGVLMKLG